MKKTILAFCILFFTSSIQAQQIKIVTANTKTSFRGLSVVNDNIIWASGSNGTVAKSTDGGNSWQWLIVKDFEKRDFRDIEAFDSNTAVIMAVAEPAVILKTKDGGKKWYKVFEDSTKGMFLDAMDFQQDKYGIVIGDPIDNKIFIASSDNKGESWNIDITSPKVSKGEAFFASSGTNAKIIFDNNNMGESVFVSGGTESRIFINNLPISLNMLQGKETQGANSIAIFSKKNKDKSVIVGGDFSNDKDSTGNCILFDLNTGNYLIPQTPPHGYRSCVIYIDEEKLITCGTNGIDISNDGGNNWQLISTESFHVVQKAKNGNSVFLAGVKGRIAKLVL